MSLIIGLFCLGCLVAMYKGLYKVSKAFRAIAGFLQGVYALAAVVWLIVEWIKYGWAGAFGVLLVMTLPLIVFDFIGLLIDDDKHDLKVSVELDGSPKDAEK